MARAPKRRIRPASLECVRGHQFVASVPQVGHGYEETDEVAWFIDDIDVLSCQVCGSEIDPSRSKLL